MHVSILGSQALQQRPNEDSDAQIAEDIHTNDKGFECPHVLFSDSSARPRTTVTATMRDCG